MAKSKSTQSKIYRLNDVRLGSIVGGPWAATYFFYKNFKGINQPSYAKKALVIGTLSPILFVLLDMALPSGSYLITVGLFALVVILLVQRYQTAVMRAHSTAKDAFYSNSHASLMTVAFLLLYVGALFGFNMILANVRGDNYTPVEVLQQMFGSETFDTSLYNSRVHSIASNEQNVDDTLTGIPTADYDNPEKKDELSTKMDALLELINADIKTTNDLAAMKNLPKSLSERVTYLHSYTTLRAQQIELLKKAIDEQSPAYTEQVQALTNQIQTLTADFTAKHPE